MTFSWTPHRFSGGALALDVANSVVLRFDPQRRIDRFAVPAQLQAFAAAAQRYCAERVGATQLRAVDPAQAEPFFRLRESIDRHFRTQITTTASPLLLADLLENVAATLKRCGPGDLPFETANSALRLLPEADTGRMKICPNCEWLFVDRSRNKSRTWCDMAVCGNRVKARLHYQKKKSGEMER